MADPKEGYNSGVNRNINGTIDAAGNFTPASATSSTTTVFNEQIYAGIATGNQITDGGLEDYNFWEFHVDGVDADDDVTIQISLDGANFIKPGLVDVMTGAHIDQTAAMIEADGIYVFGTVADQATRVALGVKAIKVVRETAVTGGTVTVNARGV